MIRSRLRIVGMTALVLGVDLLALCLVWSGSVWLRYLLNGQFGLELYWNLAPCLSFFLTANALVGLYPGILLSPADELKKICQTTSVIFLALSGAIFLSRQGEAYSRGIFIMAWSGSLVMLPLCRALLRRIVHGRSWWGYPAVVFGAGRTGTAVLQALERDHHLGLRPVGLLDDDPDKAGSDILGVPVLGPLDLAQTLALPLGSTAAIVAMPGVTPERLVQVLEGPASSFGRLIIIPDLFGASSLWISAFDLGGIVGLEVRQKLLDPQRQLIKRAMELLLILLLLPALALLLVVIAVWIKFDSRGPILYCHKRIGMHGREIRIWKFRTMIPDAENALELLLEEDPGLRAEWEQSQKLSRDPRITRVGRFLRHTSLDELPQLWNVLKGDLSLVGPRPIVWSEVEKYAGGFELYKKVKPGLTGLWQISGRSDTTYAERVRLDAYYVRNWSVWFDIYILLKTPLEVLRCRGAC